MSWPEIAKRVVNLRGDQPGQHAVRNAVERVQSQSSAVVAEGRYANCGRKSEISEEQGKEIVAFVKMWRHKRFCTCNYIRRELKLKVSTRTVARLLNSYGLFGAQYRSSSLSARPNLKSVRRLLSNTKANLQLGGSRT